MADLFYVECIQCGAARATDDRRSVGTFKQIHEEDTGHMDFYQGPMPAERAARIGLATEEKT